MAWMLPSSIEQAWFVDVAAEVAEAQGNTLPENARLFALLGVTTNDLLETTLGSKFHYGLWRPVTAIQRADEDGNPDTVADPTWTPLHPGTPPYPSYAGDAAGDSAAKATVLKRFFGTDDVTFDIQWPADVGGTRSYASFWEAAQETADSRIWGGIHYRFDNVAGQQAGTSVADYVFDNFFQPLDQHDDPVLNPDSPTLPGNLAPCVAQFGDANADGVFENDDLVQILQSAKYRTGQPATFAEGNWNDDDVFDQKDIVAALQFGDYSIDRHSVSCVLVDGEHVLRADEIGAANRMNAQTVLEAAKLIQEGNRYSLAHVLENESPTNPFVSHRLDLDLQVRFPDSANDFVALAETVHSNFMHVGTQFDALGHIGIGAEFYNGYTFDDVFSPTGLRKLGAEEVPPFFTRGVLVDIARYKNVEILPPTYEITLEESRGCSGDARNRRSARVT